MYFLNHKQTAPVNNLGSSSPPNYKQRALFDSFGLFGFPNYKQTAPSDSRNTICISIICTSESLFLVKNKDISTRFYC